MVLKSSKESGRFFTAELKSEINLLEENAIQEKTSSNARRETDHVSVFFSFFNINKSQGHTITGLDGRVRRVERSGGAGE